VRRSAAALAGAVKSARSHPALNLPLTTLLRAGLRGLGWELPWLVKHLPRSGVVSVRLPNHAQLRLWSRGDDWISTQIFWRGLRGYEPETVSVFFALAQRAAVIVDVGAYVGYFTVMAALANRGAQVIALEPFPATFERLQRNVSLNSAANVVCRNVAAGASAGSAELHHMSRGMSMAASLEPAHLAPWEHVTTSVPVVRLDQLLSELGLRHVDLIKLDVEATEVDVLEGAVQILQRDHPDIVCEVLSAENGARLGAVLEPLGYRFFELGRAGPCQRQKIMPSRAGNYLFTTAALPDLPSAGGNPLV
jgi:FkbM family methyltransferase